MRDLAAAKAPELFACGDQVGLMEPSMNTGIPEQIKRKRETKQKTMHATRRSSGACCVSALTHYNLPWCASSGVSQDQWNLRGSALGQQDFLPTLSLASCA